MPVKTHLAKLHELSAISFSSPSDHKARGHRSELGLDDSTRKALADSHVNFGAEYLAFFKDITQNETGIVEIPQVLTELPAVEYLNQTALVAGTSGGDTEAEAHEAIAQVQLEYASEADDELVELLNKLNRDLSDLLLGARPPSNPSTRTMFAILRSYRELFTHVLHLLAPDDQLTAWTKDPDDYHNGRPTRRTRLRYITRELQHTFGGFLKTDVDSVLSFIDSFQKGTHALRPDFAPKDVLDLKMRMEGLLRLLLVINARLW